MCFGGHFIIGFKFSQSHLSFICMIFFKVQEKFRADKISWNRAMDEVRADRLINKYDIYCLLVIIRDWPASEKYRDKPELVASLEYLVGAIN